MLTRDLHPVNVDRYEITFDGVVTRRAAVPPPPPTPETTIRRRGLLSRRGQYRGSYRALVLQHLEARGQLTLDAVMAATGIPRRGAWPALRFWMEEGVVVSHRIGRVAVYRLVKKEAA